MNIEDATTENTGETSEVLHALKILAHRLPVHSSAITLGYADNSYAARCVRYWHHRMHYPLESDFGPLPEVQ